MKRFIYFLGSIFFLLLLAIIIIPLFLPEHLEIQQKVQIQAPKNRVFDEINSLRKQVEHNTFLRQDTVLSKLFYTPERGENANFKWNSFEEHIGSGDILITKSKNDTIEVITSFDGKKKSYKDLYSFKETSPNATEIVWTRLGEPVGYLERYLLYQNWTHEENESIATLRDLKESLEANSNNVSSNGEIGKVSKEFYDGAKVLVMEVEEDLDKRKIQKESVKSWKQVERLLEKEMNDSTILQKTPMVIVNKWDTAKHKVRLDLGHALYSSLSKRPKGFYIKALPAGDVYTYSIKGNLNNIDSLRNVLDTALKQSNLRPSKFFWIEVLESNSTHDTMTLKGYQGIQPN